MYLHAALLDLAGCRLADRCRDRRRYRSRAARRAAQPIDDRHQALDVGRIAWPQLTQDRPALVIDDHADAICLKARTVIVGSGRTDQANARPARAVLPGSPSRQTLVHFERFDATHRIGGLTLSRHRCDSDPGANCMFRLHERSIKKEAVVDFAQGDRGPSQATAAGDLGWLEGASQSAWCAII